MRIILISFCLICCAFVSSQSVNNDSLKLNVQTALTSKPNPTPLRFIGNMQAQWQSTGPDGSLKVGDSRNSILESGKSINRFGIRRGQLGAIYESESLKSMLVLNVTDKTGGIDQAHIDLLDPWVKWVTLVAGVFDRPYGFEVGYSSTKLEYSERSLLIRNLFPDDKDLGCMVRIQAPLSSPLSGLKLEAGLFSGNGPRMDNDSKKDLISHLSYNKSFGNCELGVGVSGYDGFVGQRTKFVYRMKASAFEADSTISNLGNYAARIYVGADAQFSIKSALGKSSLRLEYIQGQQPGTFDNSRSPIGNVYDKKGDIINSDTYIREFRGGYVTFVQDIGHSKHSITLKYDWYDPNTAISRNQIGAGYKTGITDFTFSTLGIGYLYQMSANVRWMFYYERIINEMSTAISSANYARDLNDDIFTARIQYKF